MKTLISILAAVLVLQMGACTRYQGSDLTEREHPTLVEARERVQRQELEEAETLLRDFLRKNPDFAMAHMQLAMLYQTRQESVPAIYHFERYLEIRDEGERADIIRQVVRDERRLLMQTIAATVEGSPEAELSELRNRLNETEQKLARAELTLQQLQRSGNNGGAALSSPPAAERSAERVRQVDVRATPAPTPEPASRRTHTVQRGETLSHIARRAYGRASAWEKIYQANREIIPNPNAVPPGLVLEIPE